MAAVEFALIAPVLMLMFFGLVEVCNALSCHQKVTSVSSTADDLVGQATQVSKADLANVFAASGDIMTPFSSGTMSIVVTSIGGTTTPNVGQVLWSETNGQGVAHAVGSTLAVPTGLLPATCTSSSQCSILLSEVSYNYTSPYGQIIVGTFPMTDTFYTAPRRSITVTCTDCP